MKYSPAARQFGGTPPLVRAEFTRDMLSNLLVVFEAAAQGRPLMLEMCDREVWAVTPDGSRLFIGARDTGARPLDA